MMPSPGSSGAARRRERFRLRREMLQMEALASGQNAGPAGAARAAAELAGLRAKHESLAADAALLQDKLLRQQADFDNFRKRAHREKDQARTAAAEAVVAELLPVLDNFGRALEAARATTDTEAICKGVEMVSAQMNSILLARGLEPINAVGERFDPTLHEAVAVEERTDVPDQQVVSVMLPGYRFGERVVRPAMVRVARNAGSDPAATPAESPAEA